MKRLAVFAVVALTVGVIFVGSAQTAPKPAEIAVSWQLDFDYKPIQPIMVQLPGEAKPRLFWFMLFTVANHTGSDQIFVPDFTLYTDTAQVLRAGQHVPSAVFDKVKALYNNPLLQDMSGVSGKLLQGEDNAKDGVAIWADFDDKATSFDLFVGGLSGETTEVALPAPMQVTQTDASGKKVTKMIDKIVLSKTFDLNYTIAGDPSTRAKNTAALAAKTWVMR